MNRKQSQFTEISELDSSKFVPIFGSNTNEKISKDNLFEQIREEMDIFIYPTIEQLQEANLVADPDFPIYVRVEETEYRLYKITSLAPGVDDIALDNGTTATVQYEYRDNEFDLIQAEIDALDVRVTESEGDIVALELREVNIASDLAPLSPVLGQRAVTKGCTVIGIGEAPFIAEVASGTPDGYGRILAANGLHWVIKGITYPEQFGAVKNGVTDDGDALRRYIAFYGYLRLNAGSYAYTGTLNITQSGSAIIGQGSGITKLIPLTNFGDFVKIARAAGPLRGFILWGLTIESPSLLCTQDVLVMDGVRNFTVEDLVLDKGNRGIVIRGCSQGNFDNITIIYENDNSGTISTRRYVYIEPTANANIGSKHPGDLFFTNFNGRCGATPYCYAGWEIHSADGIWISNYHIGNCTFANVHINADRTDRCTGIKFSNGWHDIGTGSGTVIEGSTPTTIGNYQFDSVRSLGGNTGLHGYDISGSANNIHIGGVQSKISGYLRNGIGTSAGFTGSVFVYDTEVLDCSLDGSGSYDAIIDRSTTGTLSIKGGSVAGTLHRWAINCQVGKAGFKVDGTSVVAGTSGAINYTATAGNIVRNCQGYNPRAIAAPTPSGSPYTYGNTTGYPVAVSVSGGTVSLIQRNGTTVTGKTSIDTVLANGESITVTYTVAPNVFLAGL